MAALEKDAKRVWHWALLALVVWAGLAYVMLPRLWTHHEHQPGIKHLPMVTQTKQGIPGDPIDVGLVGTREDVIRAMYAAGWRAADPVTLKSSLEIIGSVLLDRPDPQAPVSPLYYDGRVEDLAFEKEIGRSADRRDHVRFWKVLDVGKEGAPVWLGSATYTAASASAITPAPSPTISARTSIPCATSWSATSRPPAWCATSTRSPASARPCSAGMAAAIPITPTARSGLPG